MGWRAWLCAAAMALLAPLLGAQELRAVPALTARVIDQTGTLTPEQRAALESKLAAFEREAGPQIVVLIVPGTAPEDITDFTQRAADVWKIGRREVGDGLLLVVAKDERRVRIAPAKALEGAVPDLAARQIIDRAIVPAFRAGDYAGGLNAALDQLIARIKGEHLPAPEQRGRAAADQGADWGELMMFFFVGVPILGAVLTAMFGRKLGSLVTAGGAGTAAWWLSSSLLLGSLAGAIALVLVGVMGVGGRRGRHGSFGSGIPPVIWGGGGGGSGWGGGGFSSGGGGDFGGGGASGNW